MIGQYRNQLALLLLIAAISDVRSGRALMTALEKHIENTATLAFAGWPEQFLLQWDRPVVHFGYRRPDEPEARDAATWLLHGEDRRVLLPERMLQPCFRQSALEFVGQAHRKSWYIADQSAVTGICGDIERPVRDVVVYRADGHSAG